MAVGSRRPASGRAHTGCPPDGELRLYAGRDRRERSCKGRSPARRAIPSPRIVVSAGPARAPDVESAATRTTAATCVTPYELHIGVGHFETAPET